jgi:hypothetical protein
VGSDQDGSELLEVAVVFILNLGDTPRVLTALDNTTIAGLDVLFGADDGKWHGGHETSSVLGGSFVIFLDGGLVDLDVLGLNDGDDL